jgi:hypothetical protein
MPVQVRAYCPTGAQYYGQPGDEEDRALPRADAGEVDRYAKQHARKDVGRRPGNGRQNIGGIELARRHPEDACNQRHEGAHYRYEARQKDTCGAVFFLRMLRCGQ